MVLILYDLNTWKGGKDFFLFQKSVSATLYYQWEKVLSLLKWNLWLSVKCAEVIKQNIISPWHNAKISHKIWAFLYIVFILNYFHKTQSVLFFNKTFGAILVRWTESSLLTFGDQLFDNSRTSIANGIIACRVQLNMIYERNQALWWLFRSNPFSFELQHIFQQGESHMKKFSADHTDTIQPSYAALWVCCLQWVLNLR